MSSSESAYAMGRRRGTVFIESSLFQDPRMVEKVKQSHTEGLEHEDLWCREYSRGFLSAILRLDIEEEQIGDRPANNTDIDIDALLEED